MSPQTKDNKDRFFASLYSGKFYNGLLSEHEHNEDLRRAVAEAKERWHEIGYWQGFWLGVAGTTFVLCGLLLLGFKMEWLYV